MILVWTCLESRFLEHISDSGSSTKETLFPIEELLIRGQLIMFGFDLELRVRVCMHGAGKRDHAVSRFQSGRQGPCPGDGMDHHALTDWQFVDGPRQGMIRL